MGTVGQGWGHVRESPSSCHVWCPYFPLLLLAGSRQTAVLTGRVPRTGHNHKNQPCCLRPVKYLPVLRWGPPTAHMLDFDAQEGRRWGNPVVSVCLCVYICTC